MARKDPDFLCAEMMAEVLAEVQESEAFEAPVLVIGEPTGLVVQSLSVPHESWARRAGTPVPATPLPPEGPFGTAILRMTRSVEELRFTMALAARRLLPGGKLYLFGSNDEGIRSAAKAFAANFESPQTLLTKRHCRVFGAVLAASPTDDDLQGFQEAVRVETETLDLTWMSWPGMFAHGRLDKGSAFLIQHLPELAGGERVLDYGCGAGVLSLALQRQTSGLDITLFDNDALALRTAEQNVEGGEGRCGTSLKALEGETYDLILSNPPIHSGKAQTFKILEKLIEEAPRHLLPGGRLRLVVQGTVPVARIAAGTPYRSVVPVAENRSFVVWDLVV